MVLSKDCWVVAVGPLYNDRFNRPPEDPGSDRR